MKTKTIEWATGRLGDRTGSVGGLRLFAISYGVSRSDTPWSLTTGLPIRHPLIGQVHATPEDAKAAAQHILDTFARRITTDDQEADNG